MLLSVVLSSQKNASLVIHAGIKVAGIAEKKI